MIKVALKDGSIKEFENAISVMDVAKSISEGLARNVVAVVCERRGCRSGPHYRY